jgi:hypothetical protein
LEDSLDLLAVPCAKRIAAQVLQREELTQLGFVFQPERPRLSRSS